MDKEPVMGTEQDKKDDHVTDPKNKLEQDSEYKALDQSTWDHILSALRERDHRCESGKDLSKALLKRIAALKKNQEESILVEARFHQEVHRLECKYGRLLSAIWARREAIIDGQQQENSCVVEEEEEDEDTGYWHKVEVGDWVKSENVEGVPYFWLVVLKNAKGTTHLVTPRDEPLLKHLLNIELIQRPADPMGFILIFRFGKNDYFSNLVLTKQYEMRCRPDKRYPHSFRGNEIYKTQGSTIHWYTGKNLTLRQAARKRRRRTRRGREVADDENAVRTESFFNLFGVSGSADDPLLEAGDREALAEDFETGSYLRERILPRAVNYFTGDATDNESDEESDSSSYQTDSMDDTEEEDSC